MTALHRLLSSNCDIPDEPEDIPLDNAEEVEPAAIDEETEDFDPEQIEIAKMLIGKGVDVNAVDSVSMKGPICS